MRTIMLVQNSPPFRSANLELAGNKIYPHRRVYDGRPKPWSQRIELRKASHCSVTKQHVGYI